MTIAFAGHRDAFNFHKIGGTDALVRRIALHLAQSQHVFVVTYDNKVPSRETLAPGITLLGCVTFRDLLDTIEREDIGDVVTIYFRARDRLRLIMHRGRARFHTVVTTYHSKRWKRWAHLLSSALCFDGMKFCISKRIEKDMARISKRSVLFWPPVDDDFFAAPVARLTERSKNRKTRIAYMGRLDEGKGADIALKAFESTAFAPDKYELFFYAYSWANDVFSQKLHARLQDHTTITYVEAKLIDDLDKMDASLRARIDETDAFILPYRALLSTIDSPLLPMEIAARGKPFITTDVDGLPSLPVTGGEYLSSAQISNPVYLEKTVSNVLQDNPRASDRCYNVSAIADVMCQAIQACS